MPYLKSLLVLLYLCAFSANLKAQSQFTFNNLTSSEGLSNGSVTAIAQDQEGFIWLGTKNGLNRYDGLEFKVFDKSNSALMVNDISTLLTNRKGQLWVGTIGGGLYCYDEVKEIFYGFHHKKTDRNTISSDRILTIMESVDDQLWIGTEGGLNRLNLKDSSFHRYLFNLEDSTIREQNHVTALLEGKNQIWVGTYGGGLYVLNQSSGTLESVSGMYREGFIHDLEWLSDHEILIGTSGEGLMIFDTKIHEFQSLDTSGFDPIPDIIRVIYLDNNDIIWIGSDGDGLFSLDKDRQVTNFMNDNRQKSSIISNSVYSIFEDNKRNIWIGSAWHGLSIIDHQQQQFEFYYNDIIGEEPIAVLSIYCDQEKLLLGSDGKGLTSFDFATEEVNHWNKDLNNSVGGDFIQFIKPGLSGNFWFGTFSNGLLSYNFETGHKVRYMSDPGDPGSITFNDVRDIEEDLQGGAWIATWGGGLNYLDETRGTFRALQHDESNARSISSNNVLALEPGNDGKLWAATFGGGVNLFDPVTEEFESFRHNDENSTTIAGDNVLSICKDTQGYIWFGTWENGVSRFDPVTREFKNFTMTDGLSNNTISAILMDNDGNLWMSTKSGITKYDFLTGKFNAINHLEGEYHFNSAAKRPDGKLYFGNLDGVVAFYPEEVKIVQEPLRVTLTSLKLFNEQVFPTTGGLIEKQIQFQEEVRFEHDQNVITLEFAAQKFPKSTDVEYAIKLDNFDDDWREIGDQRNTTFTNLSPGDYVFQVRARVPGNEWPETATHLEITVLKPWWLRWWAFLGYAAAFLILLYLFRKYTLAYEDIKTQLKIETINREKDAELNHLKLKFFTNISHEIRTPITLITGAINRISEGDKIELEQQQELASSVQKNSNHLLHLVEEILDFRKLDSEGLKLQVSNADFTAFSREVFLSFTYLAEKNHINYQFKSVDNLEEVWFDPGQFEKVYYNLLSNAFKHTPNGGQIALEIEEEKDTIIIQVTDSGQGIAQDQIANIFQRFYQTDNKEGIGSRGYGIGLAIVKEIVNLHGGRIEVESEPKKGTKFILTILKGNSHFDHKVEQTSLNTEFSKFEQKDRSLIDWGHEIDGEKGTQQLLVVEDNEEVRKYIVQLLEPIMQVRQAANGEEGMKIALEFLPDLIISDVMMPVMDGVNLTLNLKKDKRTSHIPIILLTARTSLVYKKEGYEVGADAYITKPFNERLLIAQIKNLLDNRQRLRQKWQTEKVIQPKELELPTADQTFLEELLKVIENNIGEQELKAEYLSRELSMSHSVVYKKVKALTGLTLIEFVRDFRLKRAAQLMIDFQFTVTEACYKVGFNDRRYFSQMFKKKFGKNPSEYVKSQTHA